MSSRNTMPQSAVVLLCNQACQCTNIHQTLPLTLPFYALHPLLPSWFTFSFATCQHGNRETTEQALNLFTSLSSMALLERPQSFCWCIAAFEPFSVDIVPLHMKEWVIRDPQQLVWKGHASRGNMLQLHILFPWSLCVCASAIMC